MGGRIERVLSLTNNAVAYEDLRLLSEAEQESVRRRTLSGELVHAMVAPELLELWRHS